MSDVSGAVDDRIPVLIIAGYAAAGKTTLVNRLLASCAASGISAGVIAHRQAEEFGIEPLAIDAASGLFVNAVYDFGSGCALPNRRVPTLLTD